MTAPQSPYQSHEKELKDYYWTYADILWKICVIIMRKMGCLDFRRC